MSALPERRPDSPDRVLVVDDDDDAAWTLMTLLTRRLGCRVRVCGDGSQAVDAVCDFRPDVVLMDIRMPGVDGLEAADLIGDLFPAAARPRLIAMTGGDIEDLRPRLEAGFDGWLRKPLSWPELVAALAPADTAIPSRGP